MAQGQQQEQQLLRIDSSGRNEADAPDDFVVVGQHFFLFLMFPHAAAATAAAQGPKKWDHPNLNQQ
jgi:hypothetical protein